ncbi:hypothetical protein [Saccharopolyspora shandongensis]|uniref:hypothetical protein n=1 Tax=Saccharopolyspora shandongensis TaxID=418495 RepID=UPI0033D71CA7
MNDDILHFVTAVERLLAMGSTSKLRAVPWFRACTQSVEGQFRVDPAPFEPNSEPRRPTGLIPDGRGAHFPVSNQQRSHWFWNAPVPQLAISAHLAVQHLDHLFLPAAADQPLRAGRHRRRGRGAGRRVSLHAGHAVGCDGTHNTVR